ncbi:MAG TPA: hypothetical protein PLR88_01705 [Bacteroidales bacterium]|nr:hypothetical protein [Bacteroidales bacterium]
MRKYILIVCTIFVMTSYMSAQQYEPVTVKAGTKVISYFPPSKRYLYPNFTEGSVILDNGNSIPNMMNYNILSGEMEFLKSKDTLFIGDKKNIKSIVIAQDTFFYYNGYMEMIQNGKFKVYLRQTVELKDIQKEGAFGTINRSSASESYGFVLSGNRSLDLTPTENIVLQRVSDYFFSLSGYDFIQFTRSNVMKSIPTKKDKIKNYLKTNSVNFNSKEDLLKFSVFLNSIL